MARNQYSPALVDRKVTVAVTVNYAGTIILDSRFAVAGTSDVAGSAN